MMSSCNESDFDMHEEAAYYTNMASKWATEYPSSETMTDIWSFYKECGYANAQATLLSMFEQVKFSESPRILDFGSDKGLMLDFFCQNLEQRPAGFGLDINPAAIESARQKFPSYKFDVVDGISIPYENKYFDVVVCMATIKHIKYEHRDLVYNEINRVAKFALMIEADTKEQKPKQEQGWTFYNSPFEKEFEIHFEKPLKIEKVGGDILGLYKCEDLL